MWAGARLAPRFTRPDCDTDVDALDVVLAVFDCLERGVTGSSGGATGTVLADDAGGEEDEDERDCSLNGSRRLRSVATTDATNDSSRATDDPRDSAGNDPSRSRSTDSPASTSAGTVDCWSGELRELFTSGNSSAWCLPGGVEGNPSSAHEVLKSAASSSALNDFMSTSSSLLLALLLSL